MSILIKEIEVCVPEEVRENEFYLEHFNKQGKDISGLLNALGRKERHIAKKGKDSTVTLAVNAAKKVLAKANLTGQDIDLIIVSSQCPEYTWPSQAVIIHGMLQANPRAQVYDINVSCAGMTIAFDSACRNLMTSKTAKRALVIGSDCMSFVADENDELTYPLFGDAACAVILERDDEVSDRGFIDSECATYGQAWDSVTYPVNGFSNTSMEESKYVRWGDFDNTHITTVCMQGLERILKRNDLKHDDIALQCYSQYALASLVEIENDLKEQGHKVSNMKFVADKYGYTGTTSPFMALYEAINAGEIKRGDLINIWTIGITWSACHILIRY